MTDPATADDRRVAEALADLPTPTVPTRPDARRSYDRLLAAARDAFAADGADVALEEVAKRAGVGIATLYRHFPTRTDLFESVYVHEVRQLCTTDLSDVVGAWPQLVLWLHRFVAFIRAKRAFAEAMSHDTDTVRRCRTAIYAVCEPLVRDARRAGAVRPEVSADDMMRLLSSVAAARLADDAQLDRLVAVCLDGFRAVR